LTASADVGSASTSSTAENGDKNNNDNEDTLEENTSSSHLSSPMLFQKSRNLTMFNQDIICPEHGMMFNIIAILLGIYTSSHQSNKAQN